MLSFHAFFTQLTSFEVFAVPRFFGPYITAKGGVGLKMVRFHLFHFWRCYNNKMYASCKCKAGMFLSILAIVFSMGNSLLTLRLTGKKRALCVSYSVVCMYTTFQRLLSTTDDCCFALFFPCLLKRSFTCCESESSKEEETEKREKFLISFCTHCNNLPSPSFYVFFANLFFSFCRSLRIAHRVYCLCTSISRRVR